MNKNERKFTGFYVEINVYVYEESHFQLSEGKYIFFPKFSKYSEEFSIKIDTLKLKKILKVIHKL